MSAALALNEIGNENAHNEGSLEPFTEGDDECAQHGFNLEAGGDFRNLNVA
jgi:hypothetical protein